MINMIHFVEVLYESVVKRSWIFEITVSSSFENDIEEIGRGIERSSEKKSGKTLQDWTRNVDVRPAYANENSYANEVSPFRSGRPSLTRATEQNTIVKEIQRKNQQQRQQQQQQQPPPPKTRNATEIIASSLTLYFFLLIWFLAVEFYGDKDDRICFFLVGSSQRFWFCFVLFCLFVFFGRRFRWLDSVPSGTFPFTARDWTAFNWVTTGSIGSLFRVK